ncbi:hypothetical protein COB52_04270 [Candidatus Kaiserbacteria bacterium]|nr:MAG: hypothetical protein COB52_04270 [Candidatus Kaiserbacteria bacterium]
MKCGADPDVTNYSGHSSLFCAAREGDLEIVRALVVDGKVKVDHYGLSSVKNDDLDDDGIDDEYEKALFEGLKCSKTALHVACLLGYDDIVQILVENNSNPNVEGEQGYNALHFALLGRKPEIAEYLLINTKVRHNHKDKHNKSCQEMAFEKFPEYKDDFEKLIAAH